MADPWPNFSGAARVELALAGTHGSSSNSTTHRLCHPSSRANQGNCASPSSVMQPQTTASTPKQIAPGRVVFRSSGLPASLLGGSTAAGACSCSCRLDFALSSEGPSTSSELPCSLCASSVATVHSNRSSPNAPPSAEGCGLLAGDSERERTGPHAASLQGGLLPTWGLLPAVPLNLWMLIPGRSKHGQEGRWAPPAFLRYPWNSPESEVHGSAQGFAALPSDDPGILLNGGVAGEGGLGHGRALTRPAPCPPVSLPSTHAPASEAAPVKSRASTRVHARVMAGMRGRAEASSGSEGRAVAAASSSSKAGGVMEQLLCGAFAGVVSRTAVAPVDLVKTHLISSHGMEGAKTTALSVLTSILQKDGWVGLFRGNGINCLRVAPNKAIELCTFQMLKRVLCVPGHPLQHIAAPLSGGAAGMAGTIATYPLEVMRTRISVQPERYANLTSTFSRMVKEEGMGSLYRGLPVSLIGVFPYAATNYFVYDALRGLYQRATGQDRVPTGATLLFGALAASVSSAVTFPLEVARRHLQLGSVGNISASKSGMAVINTIVQKEGWPALYRGLGTTWLKLIPAAGISFVCYEAARYALRVDDASCAAAAAAATSGTSSSVAAVGRAHTRPGTALRRKVEHTGAKPKQGGATRVGALKAATSEVVSSRSPGSTSRTGVKMVGHVKASSMGTVPKVDGDVLKVDTAQKTVDSHTLKPAAVNGCASGSGQCSPPDLDVGILRPNSEETLHQRWREAMSHGPLPSPFGLGATLVALRDGLEEAEDLRPLCS